MYFENININDIIRTSVARDGIIVDVRSETSFKRGHIPMAMNVPLEEIDRGNIHLPKSRCILVYCDSGGSSAMAARILSEQGYQVVNTVGGLRQYNKALTLKR